MVNLGKLGLIRLGLSLVIIS